MNALQQQYKSRPTTELQKYNIVNRSNICAVAYDVLFRAHIVLYNFLFFQLERRIFERNSPGKV